MTRAPAPLPPAGRIRDQLADFSADSRLLLLSGVALVIGAVSALVARVLLALIDLITALAYHGALRVGPGSPVDHHLGPWAALVPVIGGARDRGFARQVETTRSG